MLPNPSPIPDQESLTVEFKSDQTKMSDPDLVNLVVCMANTEGGDIYLGVEDDGRLTGLHADHHNLAGLPAMIAHRTQPPLSVTVEELHVAGNVIAKINVPKSRIPVATSEGLLRRRQLLHDGTPECVPFYPHEIQRRQSDLGILDYSARPVREASVQDFDPLERERLRQMIGRYGGDSALLSLNDEELDGALGFVTREEGAKAPTVAGLLIVGREAALRRYLPTHETAFQVMEGTQVRVNDFYRTPLLKTFERIIEQFEARVEEDEVQISLFRVPVPNYDRGAFREALVNALIHRDYTRLGAVHVRMESDGIVISNPGGFVEGVTLENLLVVEPRPRNPLLADIVKRIGLAERTGRGVDLIYKGLLRYGRPAPNYNRSDAHSVVLQMSNAKADIPFLQLIIAEEERTGEPLPVDSLIALAQLRTERRLDVSSLAKTIQKNIPAAKAVLERLVEADLAKAYGVQTRTYSLSRKVYQQLGQSTEYARQASIPPGQQEQWILEHAQEYNRITRTEVIEICGLSETQASRLLGRLAEEGKLLKKGKSRGTHYVPK